MTSIGAFSARTVTEVTLVDNTSTNLQKIKPAVKLRKIMSYSLLTIISHQTQSYLVIRSSAQFLKPQRLIGEAKCVTNYY